MLALYKNIIKIYKKNIIFFALSFLVVIFIIYIYINKYVIESFDIVSDTLLNTCFKNNCKNCYSGNLTTNDQICCAVCKNFCINYCKDTYCNT